MNRSKQSTNTGNIEMRSFNLTAKALGAIFVFLLLISFSPAHAIRDRGYLSLSGGAALFSGVVKFSDVFGPGFNIEVAGGRYLGSNLRLEAMLGYSINRGRDTYSTLEYYLDTENTLERVIYQANAYYSFIPAPSPHELFIGVGIGATTTIYGYDVTFTRRVSSVSVIPDYEYTNIGTGFAFNVSAGYNYFTDDNIAFGVSYRFIGEDFGNVFEDVDVAYVQSHNISATITFVF